MPIVPGTLQPISLDVPGVGNIPANTAVSDALQRAGAQVADSGLQLLEQVKRSEAIDASSRAAFDDKYASDQQLAELKLKYPTGYVEDRDSAGNPILGPDGNPKKKQNVDGTYRTITQEYRDWANKRYEDNQRNLPTEMAQQLYKAKSGEFFNDHVRLIKTEEMQLRTDSFKRGQETDLLYGSNQLVQAPNVADAYTLGDTLNERVHAQTGVGKDGKLGLFNPKQADDARDKNWKEIGDALIPGMIDQVLLEPKGGVSRQAKIQQALDVLNGTDPTSQYRSKILKQKTLSESMDPDKKAAYIHQLAQLMTVADGLDASDWHRKMTASKAQLELEKKDPTLRVRTPMNFSPLYHEGLDLLRREKLTPFQFAQEVGELVAKNKFNQVESSPGFLLASPESKHAQIEAIAASAHKEVMQFASPEILKKYPQASAEIRRQIVSDLVDLSKKRDEKAHEDFVEFQLTGSPAGTTKIKAFTGKLNFEQPGTLAGSAPLFVARAQELRKQADYYFGHYSSDFRVLSKDEASKLGGWITDAKTSHGEVAQVLNALKTSNPNVYATTIDQLIKDKKIGAEYRLAMTSGNTYLNTEIIRTIKDGDKIRENAETLMKANDLTPKDFEAEVAKKAAPFLIARTRGNHDSSLAAQERSLMTSVIATKAMDLYAYENGARKPEEYADAAVDAFVRQHNSLIVSERTNFLGMSNGKVKDAVIYPGKLSKVETDNFSFWDQYYKRSEQLQKLGVAMPPNAGPIAPEAFYGQVSQGNFVLTDDHSGYYLKYYDRTQHGWVRAMTAKKDRLGRPVPLVIPKEKMIAAPPSKQELAPGMNTKPDKSTFQQLKDLFNDPMNPITPYMKN
jgi:hypothetical protein